MEPKCPSCASERSEPSAIEGACVRPDRASTLKKVFNVGGIISCRACMDCGAIFDLRADPKALAKMLE